MPNLQQRIAELRNTTGWSVVEIAQIAKVSPSAVSQWLGHGAKEIKSIGNFEAALRLEEKSGFGALWLAKGKGPKHSEKGLVVPSSKGAFSPQVTLEKQQREREYSAEIPGSSVDTSGPSKNPPTEIPTAMSYEPRHLKNAILLMGNLLGALDVRSKKYVGDMLQELALKSDDPEEIEDIANKASSVANVQKPVTKNAELAKSIRGRGDAVETNRAPLEH